MLTLSRDLECHVVAALPPWVEEREKEVGMEAVMEAAKAAAAAAAAAAATVAVAAEMTARTGGGHSRADGRSEATGRRRRRPLGMRCVSMSTRTIRSAASSCRTPGPSERKRWQCSTTNVQRWKPEKDFPPLAG